MNHGVLNGLQLHTNGQKFLNTSRFEKTLFSDPELKSKFSFQKRIKKTKVLSKNDIKVTI